MLLVSYLSWWYGRGWRDSASGLNAWLHRTYLEFSVPLLATTLFAPWRRIITGGGGSLEQRFRAMVDNLVSRVVGFVVRLIVLVTALLLLSLGTIFGGLALILWPAIPPLALVLIFVGVVR